VKSGGKQSSMRFVQQKKTLNEIEPRLRPRFVNCTTLSGQEEELSYSFSQEHSYYDLSKRKLVEVFAFSPEVCNKERSPKI